MINGLKRWLGLGLLWTSLVQAQSIPDTLDWRRYFPLQVGNEWQYYGHEILNEQEEELPDYFVDEDSLRARYTRWRIIGDTVLNGVTRFITEIYSKTIYESNAVSTDTLITFVYYDTASAQVCGVVVPGEKSPSCIPWGARLDAPLNSWFNIYWVEGKATTLELSDSSTINVVIKSFEEFWGNYSIHFISDIGYFSTFYGGIDLIYNWEDDRLAYARVGGLRYGTPVLTLSEPKSVKYEGAGIVSVWPHPVRSSAQVLYVVRRAGAVRLLLYDVLGRRVRQAEPGFQRPGRHQVQLWLADLPAGVYLLRLEQEGQLLDSRSLVVLP